MKHIHWRRKRGVCVKGGHVPPTFLIGGGGGGAMVCLCPLLLTIHFYFPLELYVYISYNTDK